MGNCRRHKSRRRSSGAIWGGSSLGRDFPANVAKRVGRWDVNLASLLFPGVDTSCNGKDSSRLPSPLVLNRAFTRINDLQPVAPRLGGGCRWQRYGWERTKVDTG
jgi:hypothetical protein